MDSKQAYIFRLAFLLLASCATSSSLSIELFGSTQASIRAADEAGAKSVPSAALYTKLAAEQLERAKALVGAGRNDDAEDLLQRALLDAELSLSLAKEAQAVAAAERAERLLQEGTVR